MAYLFRYVLALSWPRSTGLIPSTMSYTQALAASLVGKDVSDRQACNVMDTPEKVAQVVDGFKSRATSP
jgi:hypothetical protein